MKLTDKMYVKSDVINVNLNNYLFPAGLVFSGSLEKLEPIIRVAR